ncbi:MAG: sensor histidine kinase [Lachnospiraceae bacterium]
MSKKHKDNLVRYIRGHRKVILVYVLFTLVSATIFVLYQLPVAAVGYAAAVCGFLGLLILACDYRKFCRRRSELGLAQKEITVSAERFPGASYPLDTDYQNIIKELFRDRQEIMNEKNEAFSEMMEYYTLWVHQIKTPIAALRLQLQEQDSAENRQMLEEVQRIEQYVEMVLTYLRLDSDSTDYVIRQYDLDDIIRQALRRFAPQFIRRKLQLIYEPLCCQVLTDEKWLLFVVEQVISNALKYTKKGSISITLEDHDILCIRDTGIGIRPEDLPRIFEKGYTGCNGRDDKKASGIGLYLCRRICDRLGHGILAESDGVHGTAVKIDLSCEKLEVE